MDLGIKLENVIEHIVSEETLELMKKSEMCTCEKCRSDVMAIALNNLPPKYIVTVAGFIMESYNMNKLQGKVDVYKEIFDAINIVKENPMHEEYLKLMEANK